MKRERSLLHTSKLPVAPFSSILHSLPVREGFTEKHHCEGGASLSLGEGRFSEKTFQTQIMIG